MKYAKMKQFRKPIAALAGLALLSGCAQLTLAWTNLTPDGAAGTPALTAPSVDVWEEERTPLLREALQREVYGRMPDDYALTVLGREVLDETAFNGAGVLTEFELRADVTFGGETATTDTFYMDVVTPRDAPNAPVILMQTFCPRWDTFPHPAVTRPDDARGCNGGGIGDGLMTYIFGRYIATPPTEEILSRGYAIATIFPSEFAPDRREEGLSTLAKLASGVDDPGKRWGAVAAWAWGFSLMVDALEQDSNAGDRAFVAWGHSRYGKSALLAAAFDERIDGVISHQSGTGGASLNRGKKGESVKSITDSYPHWFARNYAAFAGREEEMSVDQHHLLALIAPRPILLGNARRDVWSDPNGAFRAAMGADPAYELYGVKGLDQERLDEWKPDADLAFWIRAGTHGVVKEDWPAFLEFLDAHFSAPTQTAAAN